MNSPPHLPHPCHLHPLPPTHLPSPQGGNAADQPRLRTALAAASAPAMINATLEFMLTPQCKLQVGWRGEGVGKGGASFFAAITRIDLVDLHRLVLLPLPVSQWGCGGKTFTRSPPPQDVGE